MPTWDKDDVKEAARGRWAEVLGQVTSIPADSLTGQRTPCPKCGGDDRWRVFDNFSETGGAVCNRCGKMADGIAVIMWSNIVSFQAALELVGQYLRVPPKKKGRAKSKQAWKPSAGLVAANNQSKGSSRPKRDPVADKKKIDSELEIKPLSSVVAKTWCSKKSTIVPAAILSVGGVFAKYRKKYSVIAIPTKNSQGEVSAWMLYEINGNPLPGPASKDGKREQIKVKVVGRGSSKTITKKRKHEATNEQAE